VALLKYAREGADAGNSVVDNLLASDPKNSTALVLKARFLMRENKLDEALKAAQAAAVSDPRSIQAHYLMGTIYRATNQPDEAIRSMTEVLKLNPRASAAQAQLAELNLQRGRASDAVQLAGDAVRQVPNDPRLRLTLVRSLLAANQLPEAKRAVTQLLTAFPTSPAVQVLAGRVAFAQRDVASAAKYFLQAADTDKGNMEAVAGLLRTHFASKRPAEAKQLIEERLKEQPDNSTLLLLASQVYATVGDLAASERALRHAIEVDESNLQAYSSLGQLYSQQGRVAEARSSFEELLKRQPDAVPVQTVIAILYEVEGNRKEAEIWYERILKHDASAAVAANNLAYIYVSEGRDLDTALQLAQAARQKLPESPEVSDTLGWIYVKKDLANLAIPHLEEAVTRAPSNAVPLYHLGVALAKTGDVVRGRRALERAIALKLNPTLEAEARRFMATL
jgi:tetratricopeptide (TPR) repeat protein